MKKRLISLSLLMLGLLSINTNVNAQTHYEPNLSVGVKGGTTFSRSAFAPSVPQNMIMGYMGGITFRYSETRNFGVIVELNLEQRGWKEAFDGAPLEYKRQFTYIQMPMLTHIFFGNHKIKGFFNAGPEIGLMIGDKVTTNFDINNISSIPNFPKNHRTEQYQLKVNSKFDYGISAGAGMEYFINKKNSLMLEGRFYYGLGNVFGSRKADAFSSSAGMSIMVNLGYMFRIR